MLKENIKKILELINEKGLYYAIKKCICKLNKKGLYCTIKEMYEYMLGKCIINFVSLKPLKNVIIIQSQNDFDCNGGAIYEKLLKYGYNKKYKIVWILKHKIPKKLPYNVEAYSYNKFSFKKIKRIAEAKYFFADDYITKKVRKNQISIYCTHGGICFKNVKNMMNLKKFNFDYCLSPSENYNKFVIGKYNLDLNVTKLLPVGYPSQDIFFEKTMDEYKKIIDKTYKKRILWMPTFRKSAAGRNDSFEDLPFDIPLIKNEEELEKLNKILKEKDILLTLKIHPASDPKIYKRMLGKSNILVITPEIEQEKDINKYILMKYSDALISDYSGAAYEFLLLNKPLAFIVSDIKNYKIGFIVDDIYKYMPGNIIDTYEDFINFIDDIYNSNDKYVNERETLLDSLYKYKDGLSFERIVKEVGIWRI